MAFVKEQQAAAKEEKAREREEKWCAYTSPRHRSMKAAACLFIYLF